MKGFHRVGVHTAVLLFAAIASTSSSAERRFGTYVAPGGQVLEYCMDLPSPSTSVTTLVFCHHGFQDVWSTANQLGDTTTTGAAGCAKDDPNTVMHDIRSADSGNHVATIAFEYPNDQGFPALAGAKASLALRQQVLDAPEFSGVTRAVDFGVSMGGAVSGTALSENTRVGGAPISDWVVAEPVTDVGETYGYAFLANLLVPSLGFGDAVKGIQQDTGQKVPSPSALAERSPYLNAPAITRSLTGHTSIIAGAFDAEVTPDQAIKLQASLNASKPGQAHLTIVTKPAASGSSDFSLVTILCDVLGIDAAGCHALPGHEDANDPTGPVMTEARRQLINVVFGRGPFTAGSEIFDPASGQRTPVP